MSTLFTLNSTGPFHFYSNISVEKFNDILGSKNKEDKTCVSIWQKIADWFSGSDTKKAYDLIYELTHAKSLQTAEKSFTALRGMLKDEKNKQMFTIAPTDKDYGCQVYTDKKGSEHKCIFVERAILDNAPGTHVTFKIAEIDALKISGPHITTSEGALPLVLDLTSPLSTALNDVSAKTKDSLKSYCHALATYDLAISHLKGNFPDSTTLSDAESAVDNAAKFKTAHDEKTHKLTQALELATEKLTSVTDSIDTLNVANLEALEEVNAYIKSQENLLTQLGNYAQTLTTKHDNDQNFLYQSDAKKIIEREKIKKDALTKKISSAMKKANHELNNATSVKTNAEHILKEHTSTIPAILSEQQIEAFRNAKDALTALEKQNLDAVWSRVTEKHDGIFTAGEQPDFKCYRTPDNSLGTDYKFTMNYKPQQREESANEGVQEVPGKNLESSSLSQAHLYFEVNIDHNDELTVVSDIHRCLVSPKKLDALPPANSIKI